ncbi:carcinoembryonic antigen-related cell adhesion molecule 5-like, partial [Clarias magur]
VCFGQELILPERINKAVGENVVITPIRIPDPPHQYIRWSFNSLNNTILSGSPGGITILPPYTNRVHLDTSTLALELRTLTDSDTGQYTLEVQTPAKPFTDVTSLYVFGVADGNGDSLSAGAIAGIVIGVLLGLAGISGLSFYFMKAKVMPRTKSSGSKQNEVTHDEQQQDPQYVNMNEVTMRTTCTQMGQTTRPDD